MINQELQKLINKANRSVSSMLTKYANSNDPKEVKKAQTLAYWFSDYCRLIKKEDTFNSARTLRYKRGDVLQVHLGFNIGSEEGGLHYVVVISNNTPASSDILTVIPLTSKKPNYKENKYNIDLGDTIYSKLDTKYTIAEQTVSNQISDISHQIADLQANIEKFLSTNNTDNTEQLTSMLKEFANKSSHLIILQSDYEAIKKNLTEISHMKTGSIALVGQITTISKVRIYNPVTKDASLHGIKIDPSQMDLIDNKIKELFTKI